MDSFRLTLTASGLPPVTVTVLALSGREAASRTYRFDCTIEELELDAHALPSSLLGLRAELALGGEGGRIVAGLVARDERRSAARQLRLVPRLWWLRHTRRSRIFTNLALPQVIGAVLSGHRLPYRWIDLSRRFPALEHVVQRDETDLAFVERLLARAGLYYFFEQTDGKEPGERIVLGDAPVYDAAPGAGKMLCGGEIDGVTARADELLGFALSERLGAGALHLAAYDWTHPNVDLLAGTGLRLAPGLVEEHLGEVGDGQALTVSASFASARLAQHRRRAVEATASTRSPWLVPGFAFELGGHPDVDGRFVVAALEHTLRPHEGTTDLRYEARLRAIPATEPLSPPPARHQRLHVAETATVIGPEGAEVHTDDQGRVQVRFHWDRRTPEAHRTSWLRVVTPAAGAGWGVQFTPRVGQEVLVLYSGGDPDRPIVAGAIPNGTHPAPFAAQPTVSGIRTRTVGGGPAAAGGHNELSFEDASGREEVLLRAQRDLREDVGRNVLRQIKGDEYLSVDGAQEIDITGGRAVTVGGLASATLWDGARVDVKGDVHAAAGGRITLGAGEFDLEVENSARVAVRGDAHAFIDGAAVTRVVGCASVLVGSRRDPAGLAVHAEGGAALSAAEVVELRADKAIVLRSGGTSIRIDATGVEILGASIRLSEPGGGTVLLAAGQLSADLAKSDVRAQARSIVVRTEDARLALDTEAHLDGQMVRINSPASGDAEPWAPPPVTTVELTDDDGHPIAGERYVLHVGEAIRAGVLDGEGRAIVSLEPGAVAQIAFPDVREPRGQGGAAAAATSDAAGARTRMVPTSDAAGARTRMVRANEHLAAIAHELGVDAAALWAHPGNARLRDLRGDGSVLAEGDVLTYAPPPPPPRLRVEVGRVNRFQATVPTIETHLRLVDDRHNLLAGEPYVAHVAGEPDQAGRTDADGRITIRTHVAARSVTVELPRLGRSLKLGLGHVDPLDSPSGVAQRLQALGFGDVAAYQAARGLPVNGNANAATLDELRQDFGC